MNHLLREIAPITESGWGLLDEEARERLTAGLAARKLVDFAGPRGWTHSATNLGRTELIEDVSAGVRARRRSVLPLVELRADFAVAREELREAGRGAEDVDLDALDVAALAIAAAENVAVFHGWSEAGITGIAEASPHPAIHLEGDYDNYPRCVAQAVERLTNAGIRGDFGLALGPDDFTGVIETTEHGGYPVFDHLRQILGGPIVRAPGLRGGIVISQRGGDFLFESGQDLSIGYSHHDDQDVHLYVEETFSFRVATSEAAVPLTA